MGKEVQNLDHLRLEVSLGALRTTTLRYWKKATFLEGLFLPPSTLKLLYVELTVRLQVSDDTDSEVLYQSIA